MRTSRYILGTYLLSRIVFYITLGMCLCITQMVHESRSYTRLVNSSGTPTLTQIALERFYIMYVCNRMYMIILYMHDNAKNIYNTLI